MFYTSTIDQLLYSQMMEQIKQVNADYIASQKQKSLWQRPLVKEVRTDIRHGDILKATRCVYHYVQKKAQHITENRQKKDQRSQYFSNYRIAIYTVITNHYDDLLEPYCHPDNCDYFIFTDEDFDDSNSIWQKKTIPIFLEGLSDKDKNRYLKMHPHQLFKDYRYSIYVDGNVQIITDLTEYVNLLGPIGIGIHNHPRRDCVFEEMQEVLKQGKEEKGNIKRHADYMKETGMPRHYGLLECNVIVREHHNKTCIKIMEEWWREYKNYSKRDQISLPHVLYRNGIKVEEVGILGNNVRLNPSFLICKHSLKG